MDPVSLLRAVLASHEPVDDREAASRARFMAELSRLPTPFDRDADPVHVTASGIVVGPPGVVLHRHRRLGRWLQPGGHLDPGEQADEAVLRECTEETGLAVAHPAGGPVLVHVDVHDAPLGHVHLDLRYLVVAEDEPPAPPPGESQEVAWFTWAAAEALADDALIGALRAARGRMDGHVGGRPGGASGRGPGAVDRAGGGDADLTRGGDAVVSTASGERGAHG